MLAIIGGSGMTRLSSLEISQRQIVRTPYGEPSGPLTFGKIDNQQIVFLARHGHGHNIPPHKVNYRANLWALYSFKPKRVIAVVSVGGIRKDLQPGSLVVPDQIIDYTYGRDATYFDKTDRPITYTDFTYPFCPVTRGNLLTAAKEAKEVIIDGGVYAVTQGPRLETAAEVNRLERDGADMIGMTVMPEAILAKELGMPYAAIAAVVNHAAGRGISAREIPLEEVYAVLDEAMGRVRNLLEHLVKINDD